MTLRVLNVSWIQLYADDITYLPETAAVVREKEKEPSYNFFELPVCN